MINRMIKSWRKMGQRADNAEAHLAKLVELTAASEARNAALAERIERKLLQLDQLEIHLGRIERQLALSHPRFTAPLRLERYGHKVYSQNDEDGIIAEIFRRIGVTTRVFIEIAAGDGRENCSAFLLSQGWRGLWVECDDENIASIRNRWQNELDSGQLKVAAERVTVETLNGVIDRASLGDDIDILIMDIDGNDYHLLEALEARPRVICAEYSARWPPPVHWVMPRDDNFSWGGMPDTRETGASLQALEELLTPRGYSLVGTNIAGVNSFFVRSDLAEGKFAAPFTAFNHYNSIRYWYFNLSGMSAIWNGIEADGA